ncbi:MAG: hypothetical protein K6T30_06495 [Alicyclobacillus sp.]|nr:hypothetical protein [Alicyclobacillus sp.]
MRNGFGGPGGTWAPPDVRRWTDVLAQHQMLYAHWWHAHVLFTWRWWLEVAFAVLPPGLWWMWRRRESTMRLVTAGLFVLLVSSWLDFIGTSFGLWCYPYPLLPTRPPFLPWEVMLAVEYTTLVQWRLPLPAWGKGLAAGFLNAFVVEPSVRTLGMYDPAHWRYVFSLPLYALIYLAADRLARRPTFAALPPFGGGPAGREGLPAGRRGPDATWFSTAGERLLHRLGARSEPCPGEPPTGQSPLARPPLGQPGHRPSAGAVRRPPRSRQAERRPRE